MNYKKHSPEIQVAAFCHANVSALTVKKVLCLAQYSLSAVKPLIAVVKSVQKCEVKHLTSHFLHFLCRKEIVKFKS